MNSEQYNSVSNSEEGCHQENSVFLLKMQILKKAEQILLYCGTNSGAVPGNPWILDGATSLLVVRLTQRAFPSYLRPLPTALHGGSCILVHS